MLGALPVSVMEVVKCPKHGRAPNRDFPHRACGTGLEWPLLTFLSPQGPSAS